MEHSDGEGGWGMGVQDGLDEYTMFWMYAVFFVSVGGDGVEDRTVRLAVGVGKGWAPQTGSDCVVADDTDDDVQPPHSGVFPLLWRVKSSHSAADPEVVELVLGWMHVASYAVHSTPSPPPPGDDRGAATVDADDDDEMG